MNQLSGKIQETFIYKFYRSFSPASRAAILFTIPFTILDAVHYFTAGSALIFSFPLVIAIYLLCGMLAANIARQEGQEYHELPKNGKNAAFRLWIVSTAINLLISLLLGFTTFGIGFLGGLLYLCLLGPFHALGSAVIGWIGAWLYQQLHKRTNGEVDNHSSTAREEDIAPPEKMG